MCKGPQSFNGARLSLIGETANAGAKKLPNLDSAAFAHAFLSQPSTLIVRSVRPSCCCVRRVPATGLRMMSLSQSFLIMCLCVNRFHEARQAQSRCTRQAVAGTHGLLLWSPHGRGTELAKGQRLMERGEG